MTTAERIAEALFEHRYVYGQMAGQACRCGWHFITESELPATEAHRAHVAAVIAALFDAERGEP